MFSQDINGETVSESTYSGEMWADYSTARFRSDIYLSKANTALYAHLRPGLLRQISIRKVGHHELWQPPNSLTVSDTEQSPFNWNVTRELDIRIVGLTTMESQQKFNRSFEDLIALWPRNGQMSFLGSNLSGSIEVLKIKGAEHGFFREITIDRSKGGVPTSANLFFVGAGGDRRDFYNSTTEWQFIDGHWMPTKWKTKTISSGKIARTFITEVSFKDIEVNQAYPDDIFSIDALDLHVGTVHTDVSTGRPVVTSVKTPPIIFPLSKLQQRLDSARRMGK